MKVEDDEILQTKYYSLETADRLGRTLVHLAAMHGQLGLMDYLLERDADIQAQDIDGNLGQHYAVDFKQDGILRSIGNHFGPQSLLVEDNDSTSLFGRAIKKGSWRCFSYLLQMLPDEFDQQK